MTPNVDFPASRANSSPYPQGLEGANPLSNFLGTRGGEFPHSDSSHPSSPQLSSNSFPSRHPSVPLSRRSIELIKKSEGYDQPGRWPGAQSGITIGVGYDLGYVTREQFRRDWGDKLPPDQLARLEGAIGLKGQAAKARSSQFRNITISRGDADQVFENVTLPSFYERTRKAFPGLENLSPDVQGALTSLVFNRGESMAQTDRRREMRSIRNIVAGYRPGTDTSQIQRAIADQLRSMKRIWVGQGVNGLLVRREAEAQLVQSSPSETSLLAG